MKVSEATDCNRSLEAEIHRQNMGLMNCMAQNVINTDHTSYLSLIHILYAQQFSITGVVTDKKLKEPIIGASVSVPVHGV